VQGARNEVILGRIMAGRLQAIAAAQDQIAAGTAQQIEAARQIAGLTITADDVSACQAKPAPTGGKQTA
jgi:hypothetical protein